MRVRFTLVLLSFCVLASVSRSEESSFRKGYHLDLGGYLSHLSQRLSAPAGFEDKVSSTSGFLRVRRNFILSKKWGWSPAIGTLVPWTSGIDGHTKKFTTHIDFTFSYPLFSWLRLLLGPGIQWRLSFSDGGGVALNNGTGSSTFYTPRYPSNSFVVTAQGGLSFLLGSRVSVNVEVYGSGLLNSLKRNYDVAATVGWRL